MMQQIEMQQCEDGTWERLQLEHRPGLLHVSWAEAYRVAAGATRLGPTFQPDVEPLPYAARRAIVLRVAAWHMEQGRMHL
jgi:hypothetical protein